MKLKNEGFQGQALIRLPEHVKKTLSNDPLTSQLFLTDIGFYPSVNNHMVTRDIPLDQQIIIYCTDGEGWCTLNGTKQIIKKNQFFILPADSRHGYGNTLGQHWKIYWIHFKGTHSTEYARRLCDGKFGQGIPLIPRKELLPSCRIKSKRP